MNSDQIQEYAKKRSESLDNFIACFISETGLSASDILLVEQRSEDGLYVQWRCEISRQAKDARIAELEAALKPFADAYKSIPEEERPWPAYKFMRDAAAALANKGA